MVAAARASRRNRSRAFSSRSSASDRNFSATLRSRCRSSARYTSPIPPRPSLRRMVYRLLVGDPRHTRGILLQWLGPELLSDRVLEFERAEVVAAVAGRLQEWLERGAKLRAKR